MNSHEVMTTMERQLTVRIPARLAAKLEQTAGRIRRKRSEVIRLALEQFLEEGPPLAQTRPIELVRDLLGAVSSRRSDLGTRHREHLLRRLRRAR